MNIFNRSLPSLVAFRSWVMGKLYTLPHKIDLGLMRISPVDTPIRLKEQFIPLTRTTLIRKLSQDPKYIDKSNEIHFEQLCRYLDACVLNRHALLLQQLRAAYEHLNPDVELIIDGNIFTSLHRQILDDEFWCVQKLSRLLQLANFVEMGKGDLELWLKRVRGPSVVQAWIDPGQYELLKVWLLGRDRGAGDSGVLRGIVAKYWPLQARFSPFLSGDLFKRVIIAVRLKNSEKVELKMFKNMSEGELIHILPRVSIGHSTFDTTVMLCASGLVAAGLGTHWLLPAATIESGWLLTSTHELSTLLATLSAMVGFLQWHVIQQKKSHYWQWRSELNYKSIMANNCGVIGLLAERAQEEIFKEAMLSYVTLLRHGDDGVSQSQLEVEVDGWAQVNCDKGRHSTDIRIDLSESLALLRQLSLVTYHSDTHTHCAIALPGAVTLLGSEFMANNIVDSDGTVVLGGGATDRVGSKGPPVEGYERLKT